MSERPHLPRDERQFIASALVSFQTAILMRYDGTIAEKDKGAAHLAEEQARSSLAAYRRLKKGSRS